MVAGTTILPVHSTACCRQHASHTRPRTHLHCCWVCIGFVAQITVHSALQEISKNPDTLAISPAGTVPIPSWIDCKYNTVNMADGYKKYLDESLNTGSKALGSTGQQRMQAFNEWAFANASKETFICFGHSLWFRSFFREYLPDSSKHTAKNKKMKNCG